MEYLGKKWKIWGQICWLPRPCPSFWYWDLCCCGSFLPKLSENAGKTGPGGLAARRNLEPGNIWQFRCPKFSFQGLLEKIQCIDKHISYRKDMECWKFIEQPKRSRLKSGQDDPGVTRSIDWYKCSRLPVDPSTLENGELGCFFWIFSGRFLEIGILRNHENSNIISHFTLREKVLEGQESPVATFLCNMVQPLSWESLGPEMSSPEGPGFQGLRKCDEKSRAPLRLNATSIF